MKLNTLFFILFTSIVACNTTKEQLLRSSDFNLSQSDAKAITIANEVVEASGGATAWNDTRYLGWNFFGSRQHVWDKETGDVYIKSLKDPIEIKMNINDKTGEVWLNNELTTEQDSLDKYLQKGYEWWVNDSYWLVLPFKLQDSGVTLKDLGEGTTEEGRAADRLSLTFDKVGVTPQNKYHIYIDKSSRLITQWDFYNNTTDEDPRFKIPWKNYIPYGNILLSGDRGRMAITDIRVGESLTRFL